MDNNSTKRKVILGETEIEELFNFVNSKNVKYRDVSHEIVDHLASAIEDKMNKNETLTFEQGLRMVYADFPITGFYLFVQEKEKAMNKLWNKVIRDYVFSYFTTPKILVFITVLSVIYVLTYAFGQVGAVIVFAIALIFHVYSIYQNRQYFKHLVIKKEDYLIITIYYSKFMSVLFVPAILFYFSDSGFLSRLNPSSSLQDMVLSLILTMSILWTYGCINYFPQKLVQEIKTKYQHVICLPI